MQTKNITNKLESTKKNRRNSTGRTPTMSDQVNTELLEEAAFYIDYFTDTTIGGVLEQDIKANDLESLACHLKDARKVAYELEYNPDFQGAPHD